MGWIVWGGVNGYERRLRFTKDAGGLRKTWAVTKDADGLRKAWAVTKCAVGLRKAWGGLRKTLAVYEKRGRFTPPPSEINQKKIYVNYLKKGV